MRDFDPYFDGQMRHTIIVFSKAKGAKWDIKEYLEDVGFAEATPLMVRSADYLLKYFDGIISRVLRVAEPEGEMQRILGNVLFDWNGKELTPITGKQAKVVQYVDGYVFRLYSTR